jgi:hypothetical protein
VPHSLSQSYIIATYFLREFRCLNQPQLTSRVTFYYWCIMSCIDYSSMQERILRMLVYWVTILSISLHSVITHQTTKTTKNWVILNQSIMNHNLPFEFIPKSNGNYSNHHSPVLPINLIQFLLFPMQSTILQTPMVGSFEDFQFLPLFVLIILLAHNCNTPHRTRIIHIVSLTSAILL